MKWSNPVLVMAVVLLTCSCSGDEPDPLYDDNGDEDDKEATYTWASTADSLQEATYFTFLTSEGTFKQDNAGNNNFNYWWNAHMLDVMVDGFNRTGDENYKTRMKALLNGIKVRNGGTYHNEFIDDMEWLGIACLRAFNATNDPLYKEVAVDLWTEIKKGWSDVHGGGITWKTNTPNGKNACSNGPAAILAARLYQIDKNPEDREWAKKIYEWEKNTLVDPATGLVWDNISIQDGKVVINKDWIFTYNVGTYIGAAVELYTITGDKGYVNDAVKTARSTMNSSKLTSGGILKSEGQGDGGLFKGILVRYFTLLVQLPDLGEKDREDFIEFLQLNARTLFSKGISRPSMMCSPDWKEAPGPSTDLSTQLSGVMLMEAAATLKESGKIE